MASRLKNLTAAFSNVKIRTIMILAVVVLGLVIIVGVLGVHRANQASNASQLTKASNLQSVPGITATSPLYAQTQQEVNKQNYQQAAATHGTAVPTIINQQGLGANNNPGAYNLGGETNGSGATGEATTAATTTNAKGGNLTTEEAQQKAQMDAMQKKLDELSSQQEQQQIQQTQSSMQKEAQQLLSAWSGGSNNPTQRYIQGDLATSKNKTTNSSNSSSSTSITGSGNQSMSSNSNSSNSTIIKAGDILFGVLDTAVNSDEPGPVMATVVSGQYQGAKLIGSIQSSPQIPGSNGPTKLILNFTTLSVPYLPESISISAVAIDPDTARTALASDVDHHYIERYGSLFASSFLEGYGQAITQAGSTTTVSPFGGTSTTYSALTGKQEIAAGFGQVGQSWGQQLGETFNRQNTVTINSGVSVGILFLSDVSPDSGNTPASAPVSLNQAPVVAGNPSGAPTSSVTAGATGTSVTSTATMPSTVSTGNTPAPVPVPTQ